MTSFVPSGFPYRGEDWGIWSQIVFLNQRHFASGIGVLLLVLVFLVDRWRRGQPADWSWRDGLAAMPRRVRDLRVRAARFAEEISAWRQSRFAGRPPFELNRRDAVAFAFAGVLLGALPMWNGAVFVAAFVVMAALFVLMPERRYMLFLAAGAAVAAFPQLDDLGSEHMWEVEGHYQPTIQGTVGHLAARMEHRDHDDLYHYFDRHNRYSDWEAVVRDNDALIKSGEASVGMRNVAKRVFAALPAKGLVAFLHSYVVKAGFLDGRAGFHYALSLGFYYWQIAIKQREKSAAAPPAARA
jgi:hypothetical protein